MSKSVHTGGVTMALSLGIRIGAILVAIFLPSDPLTAASTGLDQVWRVPLRDLAAPAPADWDSYGVWRLSFSPDGTRLAIGFGDSTEEQEITRRIFIVLAADPTHIEAKFDVRLRLLVPWGNRLSWSPDGQHLAVPDISTGPPRTLILDVKDASYCTIEASSAFFLSSESLLGVKFTSEGDSISVFTPKCALKQGWKLHRGIHIGDVSAEMSSIAALRYDPDKIVHGGSNEAVLLDAANLPENRITASFSSDLYPGKFAWRGTALCAARIGGLKCRKVDGGREVKIPIETEVPADYEGEGNRLVISEFKKHTMPQALANALDVSNVWYTFRRRVVWDLEQSQLIAAYTPQTVSIKRKGNQARLRLFAYTISVDGKYIADGGLDSVTLYRIR